ncbi:MAG: U32 family peptidase [Firmicutes bacterium]|nr:U32 family peptidase [Bacillota bacterium]
MKKTNSVELLAPAGSPAAFYGAVKAGADAVYLGSQRFGARAYAENFTKEELIECIRYGRIMGCRLYLTVNTLMKEDELGELYDHIRPFYECGLDGVIVQDLGALRLLKEHFPGLALHASTQMTLCSSNGAELLKKMGACRIVPAREISLEEIRKIRQKVDIELETFVHGAMCYCYSGQCLFSSILGGRSGNRGRCAQPCRLPYSVETDGKRSGEQYYLSLKDMCTIEHIPELIEAGVDSFKIEGRMKKPEYAAGVTAVYRKYIDLYYELREKCGAAEAGERFLVEKPDSRRLSSLYIRSQTQDGYYFRRNGREMLTLNSPAYSGSDEALLADIRRQYLEEKKRLPLVFYAVFRKGEPASLTAAAGESFSHEKTSVTVTGGLVQNALRQPITEENIRKQLGKLGDSPFSPDEISVEMDEDVFYPLGQINELRRQAVCRLEEAFAGAGERGPQTVGGTAELSAVVRRMGEFSVSLSTEEHLVGLAQWLEKHSGDRQLACIYLSEELARREYDRCKELSGYCPLLIALPWILRESDEACLEEAYALCGQGIFSGYLIRSADGLGFLEGREKNGLWHLDASVYIWNRAAAEQLGKGIDSFCLPYELKAAEQKQLLCSGFPFEKPVYGRIPMMITANCILRTTDKCDPQSSAKTVLIDRYGKGFPVVRSCVHCTNIIYNSVPLSLHRELAKWTEKVRCRLDFTVESAEETKAVLDTFLLGAAPRFEEYTTGHERRGVM